MWPGRRFRAASRSGRVAADLLLDPGARLVIGHRGASGLAPENTLTSFDLALAQGAHAVEFDVRVTADGVPIVIHDPTLDRTTSGTGSVRSLQFADLASVDAGAKFSPDGRTMPFRDQGVRIPTLRSVLERYPEVPLLIEIKAAEAQVAVREELLRAGAERRAVVASFLHSALDAFRQPPFLVGASRPDIVALKLASVVHLRPKDRGVRAYAVPHHYRNRIFVPSRSFIRAAHWLRAPVHVWTVNEVPMATALWKTGASGVITNYPGTMAKALGSLGNA